MFKVGDIIELKDSNNNRHKGRIIKLEERDNDMIMTRIKFDERFVFSLTNDNSVDILDTVEQMEKNLVLYKDPLIIISDIDPFGEEDWNI
jgi:Txe/YoeB family toxin of Txe-Axe toxin-antitoxin module